MRSVILLFRNGRISAVSSRVRRPPAFSSPTVLQSHKKLLFQPPKFTHTRFLSSQIDTNDWRILKDETELLLASDKKDPIIMNDIVPVLSSWASHPDALQAARASQELLDHWVDASKQQYFTTAEPFLLTIKAWSRVVGGDAASKAAVVLKDWVMLLEGDLELSPTREAYNLVLKAFAKECNVKECLSMLQYLERCRSMGNLTLNGPNVETYAHVISCLTTTTSATAATIDNDALEEQWRLIRDLLGKLHKGNSWAPQNDYFILQAYCQAATCAANLGKVEEATAMLTENVHPKILIIAQLYWNEFMDDVQSPNLYVGRAYQAVFARLLKDRNAVEMDALLSQLEDVNSVDELILPMQRHYAMTIEAWSHTCTNDKEKSTILETASHCEQLLSRMEERHVETAKSFDLSIYERVLLMYTRVQQPAERILARVMNLREERDNVTIPKPLLTKAWNHVLKAYHLVERPDKVLRLWKRMQDMNIDVDSTTIIVVLKALSTTRDSTAVMKAEHILRNLPEHVEKTVGHYEAVVTACSRSSEKDAADLAQALVDELEELYDTAGSDRRDMLRPTVSIYNTLIVSHSRRKNETAAEQIIYHMVERAGIDNECPLPDEVTFMTMLDCLSRQRSKSAARKAEEFLSTIFTSENIRPNQSMYTSVMAAIVRSGDHDAPERVVGIYERMIAEKDEHGLASTPPDAVTYGVLLDMWAKSHRSDAGEHAEKILNDMKIYGVVINTMHYNNAILAHARSKTSDSFEKTEKLLREMQDAADDTIKPNVITYTNVIMALKQSVVENKAQAAWDLFEEMAGAWRRGDERVRPNVVTMNTILTSCAFTRGDDEARQRAVQLALATFSEMKTIEVAPNSISFSMMLETFGRQISDMSDRIRMAKLLFRRCQREGLVDSRVIETLRRSVPPLYEEISSQKDKRSYAGDEKESRASSMSIESTPAEPLH